MLSLHSHFALSITLWYSSISSLVLTSQPHVLSLTFCRISMSSPFIFPHAYDTNHFSKILTRFLVTLAYFLPLHSPSILTCPALWWYILLSVWLAHTAYLTDNPACCVCPLFISCGTAHFSHGHVFHCTYLSLYCRITDSSLYNPPY